MIEFFFKRDLYKQKKLSDHLSAVTFNLCKLLRVPVTLTGIRSLVNGHPFFPSILAIAESLEQFGIVTEAVEGTVQRLSKKDYPSIAHLKSNMFIVLKNIENGQVQYIDPSKGRIYCSLEDFSKIWSGVILRANPSQNAGEKDFKNKRKKEILATMRRFLAIPGLVLLTTIIFTNGLTGLENQGKFLLLWGVKLIGLFICLIIFNESAFMQYVCSLGKKFNCLKVLNSPAGKIFGISLTELGVLYFSGGLLSLLFVLYMGYSAPNIFPLALLNLITLPYTLFSIYYQAFIVKSWCLFCLSVQVLFWIEFYIFFDSISVGFFNFSWSSFIPHFIGFTIFTLIWLGLRSIIIKAKRTLYLEGKLFWLNLNRKLNQSP